MKDIIAYVTEVGDGEPLYSEVLGLSDKTVIVFKQKKCKRSHHLM